MQRRQNFEAFVPDNDGRSGGCYALRAELSLLVTAAMRGVMVSSCPDWVVRAVLLWIVVSSPRALAAGAGVAPASPVAPSLARAQPPLERLQQLAGVTVHQAADGRPFRLERSGLHHRPVLLTLWATWCEPCLRELPVLQRLSVGNASAVSFIGVAQDLNSAANRGAVRAVLAKSGVTYPQYLEEDGLSVEERIFGRGTATLPAFALFDDKGRILLRQLGAVTIQENYDRLNAALQSLSHPETMKHEKAP